ncbi:allantoate amidohydrolase [Phycicoccus endophyticus]|uniref:Allantoate amidohydrolase n=2 Tax=Phycicoccus endophyticus TaxID=1690220 RepID=A0A7G9R641_9MICO|nr:allantoate amidohydrolase [Phycicoccus endophyticus]QNN51066.1 allantoate amidohydrolase [Phycicoccus endophyticus]
MWLELEGVGLHPTTGGYRRYAWTRTDHDLREWFAGEARTRGLDLTTDRMGNQWAWWGDPDAAVAAGDPGVVVGSHLDSVPDGGAFDGPLGVVSALAALDDLRASGVRPRRPVGVVSFADEEGSRFGVACAGSRVITGAMSPERARGLRDLDGVTMAEAITRAGGDPEHLGRDEETLARVGTFVELHVEQGRALDRLGRAVGVGSDIWPHGRWRIDVPGEANHAGTTALEDREDAMLGLAAAVISARRAAQEHECLATVGKVEVVPGGVNAVASCATAWLDARGPDAEAVRRVVDDVRDVVADFDALVTEESWTRATDFDPVLTRRLATLLGGAPVIATGAGHDAGILANAGIPTSMLFVRNPTGVSHSPDEWASADDCLAGVGALADVVADLAGAPAR